MTIDRLRNVLGAIGPPVTPLELAEMLWLAGHLPSGEHADEPQASGATAAAGQLPDAGADEPSSTDTANRNWSPMYVPGVLSGESSGTVFLPAPPMLGRTLAIQRALRPFKRRTSSLLDRVVDEEATAAQLAENVRARPWIPVLAPAQERWLSLAIVIDTGPAMGVWHSLAAELEEAMVRLGAFTNVRVWTMADFAGRVMLQASSTGTAQPPAALVDATGRQTVVVLSDCSGPHWWGGRAAPALCLWARHGPTAILQPLGERLWRRTAAPVVPGQASAASPGAPNTGLRFTPHDGRARHRPGDVPVPVIELSAEWMADWAKLVSGSGGLRDTAVTYVNANAVPAHEPLAHERGLAILDRVHRFRLAASPRAAALAARVAVTEPYLPVMQLIQQRVLPGSRPSDLAEVLLSGLLEPVPAVDGLYRFIPGAREALLNTLPRQQSLATLDTLAQLSAEIEKRAGAAVNLFRAAIQVADPETAGISSERRPFALASPEALRHLHPPVVNAAGASDAAVPQPAETPRVPPAPQPVVLPAASQPPQPVRAMSASAEDGPYFFLSYAHAPRGDDRDAEDQDVWVHQLFRDLCEYIANFTGLAPSKVGFMDRELRSGDQRPWRLSWNLANCRVFVPLYSRRYFQTVHCGKEWSAFRNRAGGGSVQGSGRAETIVPALWSPVRAEQFPQAARSVQFEPRELGDAYAEYGFFAIMKLSRFKDDYSWAVLRLARHIVEVAERTQVMPGPAMDFDSLPNAFEEGALPDMAGDKRMRIIVAAPHLGSLPPGRSAAYYGQAVSDWNPFAPESVEPLAAYARGLARYLGFRPEVTSLYEQEDDLLRDDGPVAGPAIMLIDPWEVTEARCRRILARLDELNKPWIQLVVVWNRKDGEMTAAEAQLQAALDSALPITRTERVRVTTLNATRGVPALEDIPPVLGDFMRHAARQYLKYASPSGGPGRLIAPPTAASPTPWEHEDG